MGNNSGPMGDKTPKTRRDAVTSGRRNSKLYRHYLDTYLKTLDSTPKMIEALEALMGDRPYNGPLLASDIRAKDECRKQLIFHIDALSRTTDYKFVFITMFSDEYRVSKKEPILWLKRLQRKADKTLRKLGLVGAVATIEAVCVLNPPDTQQPEYAIHVHALGWANTSFDLKAAKDVLAQSTAWRHCWGISPVNIKEIQPSMGVPAWWAGYMLKHPVDAKNVIEKRDGSLAIRNTLAGYKGHTRLRLLEGLSQCRLADMLFAIGEGKYVRDPVMRKTKEAIKASRAHLKSIDVSNRRSLFKRIWSRSRAHHKKGWEVIF